MGMVPPGDDDETDVPRLGVDDEGRTAALDAEIGDVVDDLPRVGLALFVLLVDHRLHIHHASDGGLPSVYRLHLHQHGGADLADMVLNPPVHDRVEIDPGSRSVPVGGVICWHGSSPLLF